MRVTLQSLSGCNQAVKRAFAVRVRNSCVSKPAWTANVGIYEYTCYIRLHVARYLCACAGDEKRTLIGKYKGVISSGTLVVSFYEVVTNVRGQDSAVIIATCYGLDGPGIESRRGEIFRARPDRPWGPPGLLYNGGRVSSRQVKRPGLGVGHPHTSNFEVEGIVELYIYTPSGSSWPVLEWTLLLQTNIINCFCFVFQFIWRSGGILLIQPLTCFQNMLIVSSDQGAPGCRSVIQGYS